MFVHVLLQTIMVVIRNLSVDLTVVIFCAAFLFVCLRTYAVSAKLFRESCIILLICLEYSNSFTFTV